MINLNYCILNLSGTLYLICGTDFHLFIIINGMTKNLIR